MKSSSGPLDAGRGVVVVCGTSGWEAACMGGRMLRQPACAPGSLGFCNFVSLRLPQGERYGGVRHGGRLSRMMSTSVVDVIVVIVE